MSNFVQFVFDAFRQAGSVTIALSPGAMSRRFFWLFEGETFYHGSDSEGCRMLEIRDVFFWFVSGLVLFVWFVTNFMLVQVFASVISRSVGKVVEQWLRNRH